MVAADGRPLKASLNRALRRQKMRSLMLIAPLLLFIMITFIVPIGQMLFRSVENTIVSDTLPRTTASLGDWSVKSGEAPSEDVFYALAQDMVVAAEGKNHTRLGSRLNYEAPGISSLFRKSGRGVDKIGGDYGDAFVALDPDFKDSTTFADLIASPAWLEAVAEDPEDAKTRYFRVNPDIAEILPYTSDAYAAFARFYQDEGKKSPLKAKLWNTVYLALYQDLSRNGDPALEGDIGAKLTAAAAIVPDLEVEVLSEAFRKIDKDWLDPQVWTLIKRYSPKITNGYFLNSIDMQKTVDGPAWRDEDQQIYLTLFWRTLLMSVTITASCILLGYPVAWLLANLQARTANLLMIFVLLPFWTSLLVRTSAWKVLLQQQGVINDILVWLGIVSDEWTACAYQQRNGHDHCDDAYLAALHDPAALLGDEDHPASLSAGRQITGRHRLDSLLARLFPAICARYRRGLDPRVHPVDWLLHHARNRGRHKGVFISNRIAYHISSSLNWGLAAALGTILLAVVMLLYWVTTDRWHR